MKKNAFPLSPDQHEDDLCSNPTARARGANAIREWLAGFFSQVKMTNLPQSEDREVIVSGDLAVERSSYDWEWIVVGSDEPVTDQGTFIGIWRRQPDGSWKESHIMWHSWNPAG
jgi:ketosteroid isomerase-like protein